MNEIKPPIWKAILVAPIAVPLSITLMGAWESVSNLGLSGLRSLPVNMLFVFMFGLPIAYGAMLLLGLPYVMWLRSKGLLTWVFVCVGAVVIGTAVWVGYWQLSLLRPPSLARTIPVGALIGLVVGVVFSLVAKLPRRTV